MFQLSVPPAPIVPDQDYMSGLIWAYAMMPGEPARPLAADAVAEALRRPEGWVWLHLDLIDRRAHGWVGQVCGLPPAVRSILEHHDEALTLGHEAGVVYGVCADFHREWARGGGGVGRLYFAVAPRLLVTGRRHALASVEAVREALDAGLRPESGYALFEAILSRFCRAAGRRLAEVTGELDAVEDHIVGERLSNERRRLVAVRRLAVSVHRPIAALVAMFQEEDRGNWELPSSGHAMLQRLGARLQSLDREVMMVSERARLLQEEVASELAEESNRSLRALAVMTALLLPGSLVVGIFGMNTEGLPLTHTEGGFWIAMGLLGLATALFYWALLRAGASLKI